MGQASASKLAWPLATGAKVVISEMLHPLFSSGHDFLETVVFDAPHPYLGRLLDGVGEQVRALGPEKLVESMRENVQAMYRLNEEEK